MLGPCVLIIKNEGEGHMEAYGPLTYEDAHRIAQEDGHTREAYEVLPLVPLEAGRDLISEVEPV